MNNKLGLEYTLIAWALLMVGIMVVIYLVYNIFVHSPDVNLAFRNVLRNKRRSLLTLFAVATALTGSIMLGVYFLHMFSGLRESTIRSRTGHIQIMKNDFNKYGSSAPEEYLIENHQEILDVIQDNERLQELLELSMSEIRFNGILSSATSGRSLNYLGRGVDLEQDEVLSSFDIYVQGHSLREDDPYTIVIGEGLFQQLQVELDDSITLLSSLSDGGINVLDGEIGGVLRSFSKEYSNVIVKSSLEYGQEMVGTDGVNKIIFLLNDTASTEEAKKIISSIVAIHPEWKVEVFDWLELEEFYSQVHTLFSTIYTIVNSLVLGLVVFLVLNTMTMNVYERFGEFGVLRAIGVKRKKLVKYVVLEGILLGIIGSMLGFFLAYLLGHVITSFRWELPPPPGQARGYPLRLTFSFEGEFFILLLMSFGTVVGMTALSSLFPSIKAARLKIVDAIHAI